MSQPPPRGVPAHSLRGPASFDKRYGTLGQMQRLGIRSIVAHCKNCGHGAILKTDRWSDDSSLHMIGNTLLCSECEHVGAIVRPDWEERYRQLELRHREEHPHIDWLPKNEALPFKVELWTDDELYIDSVVCRSKSIKVANAAFAASVKENPGRKITLRWETQVIETTKDS